MEEDYDQYATGSHKIYPGSEDDSIDKGGGILPICTSTNRALICLRSQDVDEPGTWGIWGGKIKVHEDFKTGAKREFAEESGYSGSIKLISAFLFKNSKFTYQNYIGLVENEFNARDSWEVDDYAWVNYQELWEIEPKHFGLELLLEKSGELINKYILPYLDFENQLVEQIMLESKIPSVYETNGHIEYFPSKNFAEKTGMNWVYKDWKIPNGLTMVKIYKWLDDEDVLNLEKAYKNIITLNPELSKIRMRDINDKVDLIHGAISKFNFDDIQFYVSLTSNERVIYNGQTNIKNMYKIEKLTKADVKWVMSPKTVQRVLFELK